MDGTLNFNNKKYISAKIAAKNFGYTSDYIGQLCREKKIDSRLVGRSWYVLESDLIEHKNFHHNHSSYIAKIKTDFFIEKAGEKGRLSKKIPVKKYQNLPAKKENNFDDKKVLDGRVETVVSGAKSRIAELGIEKILYSNDNRELFPKVVKKLDLNQLKYVALKSLEELLAKPKKVLFLEKFVVGSAVVLAILLVTSGLAFGKESAYKLNLAHFEHNVKSELSFLYGPYVSKLENNYSKFKKDTSTLLSTGILEVNQNDNQLASLIFSGNSWQSVFDWAQDLAYKIIKPWLQENGGTVIVENKNVDKKNNSSQPSLTTREGRGKNIVQSRTVFVPASDREYVDFKITEKFNELKNWFLLDPLAPNVNRFYVSRQNDVIVSRVGNSSASSNSTGVSFGKSWEIDAGGYLAPTTTITTLLNNGFLATASSTVVGNATTTGSFGAGAVYVNGDYITDFTGTNLSVTNGILSASGSSSGGGSWATTTITGSANHFNYSLNSTDVVGIGSVTGTSTSKFWFDPNLSRSFLSYASSTGWSSSYASTTNFNIGGSSFNSLLGAGLQNTSNALTLNATGDWTGTLDGFDGFAFPFTVNTGYNSTSTVLGLNGFFSTASSTISNDFRQLGGYAMFGTTTNTGISHLTISSSTAPQLSLGAGAGINQWAFRNAGGNLYFATTTVAGTATTSTSALEISGSGFGTTTVRGLNISGQATTTSNVGINLSGGCYAIGGTCLSSGSGISALTGNSLTKGYFLVGDDAGLSQATSSIFVSSLGNVGIGTTTPVYRLTVASSTALTDGAGIAQWVTRNAGGNLYFATTTVAGTATTSTSALTIIGSSGNVGIGATSSPYATLSIHAGGGVDSFMIGSSTNTFFRVNHLGNIWMSTSTATTTIAGGFSVNNGAITHDFSTGQTSIDNLAFGAMNFDTDGGVLSWMDMPVSSSASIGTVESYTASIDSVPLLTLYSEADGSGNTQAQRVAIGTSTPYARFTIWATSTTDDILNVVNSASSTLFTITSTGKIGIGTTTPWGQLSVNANGLASGVPQFVVGSSTATNFVVANNGNVGIGTTNPIFTLVVNGAAAFGDANDGLTFNRGTGHGDIYGIDIGNASYNDIRLITGGTDPYNFVFTTSGNVGIGTTTPTWLLNPSSVTASQLALSAGAGISQWAFRNAGGNLYFATTTVAGTATTSTSALSIIGSSGNVGIATTTPTAQLVLQSTASASDLFNIASSTGLPMFSVNRWGSLIQNIASTTAVNIQDGSGNSVLTVDSTQTTGAGIDITAVGSQSSNLFNIFQSNGTTNYLAVGPTGNFGIASGTPAHLFTIATSTTTKEPVFDIYNSGNATSTIGFFVSTTTLSAAGIGSAEPSALRNYIIVGNGKVQAGMAIVNGGLCVDNDGWCTASTTGRISSVETTTGGTDLAEIYNSNDSLEPGEVIAISSPVNFVKKADILVDKNKALGVIATNPGIIMGLKPGEEQGKNQYPVALAGRVPVKVTTENGNIEAGDYLTLSSTAGAAMKAIEPGNVVGRALESYSNAEMGKISMFVDNTYYGGETSIITINGTSTTIYITGSSTPVVQDIGSTTATTTSGLFADSGFGQTILKFLEEVGLKMMNGIAYVKNMFVEKLTVGTPEKPTGITLYDEATGEPYCLKVVNGAMVSAVGDCLENTISEPEPIATSTGPIIIPVDPVTVATSTDPVATSTDPIVDETTSSTSEIVSDSVDLVPVVSEPVMADTTVTSDPQPPIESTPAPISAPEPTN